jgi:hypothetical protein
MYRKDDEDFTDKLMRLGRAVVSEDEFRVWVNDLSQVFEESLESRLRTDDPPRPYDIPEVARLVRDGRLDQVRRMRNYAAHADLDPRDEVVNGQILMRFTGKKFLDHDDARRWTQVQTGLLGDLVGMLEDVRKALEDAPMSPSAPQPAGLRATPYVDGWR